MGVAGRYPWYGRVFSGGALAAPRPTIASVTDIPLLYSYEVKAELLSRPLGRIGRKTAPRAFPPDE